MEEKNKYEKMLVENIYKFLKNTNDVLSGKKSSNKINMNSVTISEDLIIISDMKDTSNRAYLTLSDFNGVSRITFKIDPPEKDSLIQLIKVNFSYETKFDYKININVTDKYFTKIRDELNNLRDLKEINEINKCKEILNKFI